MALLVRAIDVCLDCALMLVATGIESIRVKVGVKDNMIREGIEL